MIIVFFAFLMIAISFGVGIWAKRKANTAQAYFGGTAMFGPLAVGLSSMAGIICLGYVGYLAAQISAMIANLVGIPPIVAGFLIFGLLSQAFQGFIMVLASLVFIITFFGVTGGFGNVLAAVSAVPEVTGANGVTKTLGPDLVGAWGSMPGGISLTWMLIPILGCVGQPRVLTRMYAVKNPRDLSKVSLVTAVTHTIVGFPAVAAAYAPSIW